MLVCTVLVMMVAMTINVNAVVQPYIDLQGQWNNTAYANGYNVLIFSDGEHIKMNIQISNTMVQK